MKQTITMLQLNELPSKAVIYLKQWALKRHYYADLSIGQMMDFLIDHKNFAFLGNLELIDASDWCDELWEEVKNTLKKEAA
jgi:hypothetical protein